MKSDVYWERRYRGGSDSGEGSRGEYLDRKATYINELICREHVSSIVDWGCGDGAVTGLLDVDTYIGVDVSATAISRCAILFPDRSFIRTDPQSQHIDARAELAMSLDVMFHLPDDADYHAHLDRLFASAARLVLIYSTNYEDAPAGHHMRRRCFTPEISSRFPGWCLDEWADDPGEAGFYLYRRTW